MSPIFSKTTVAQCDLGRISSIGKVVHGLFFTGFGFLTIRVSLKQNDSCAECFDANFEQQHSCARCFGQVLAFKEMSAISSKTTVAQCYLGPISSNRKVLHGVFYRFWHPNNTGQFQAKRRLRRVF